MGVELEIWTAAEIRAAERGTFEAGVSALTLMDRAAAVVADWVTRRRPGGSAVVLCGPGSNGGDGFAIARMLSGKGHATRVIALSGAATGAAAQARRLWRGDVSGAEADLGQPSVVVDALFGIGLSRSLEGAAARLAGSAETARRAGAFCVAVDIPSGVAVDTGAAEGAVFRADMTVTFHRRKPGHVLLPGRAFCGEVVVADIGLCGASTCAARLNRPVEAWRSALEGDHGGHKYTRGHTLVIAGGAEGVGASRLAARAALRAGSGLVTLAAPAAAFAAHIARGPDALIVREVEGGAALGGLLRDTRRNALVIGPALGAGQGAEALIVAALASGRTIVLDADALTAFTGRARRLGELIAASGSRAVLTPHEGEFARLFQGSEALAPASKIDRARAAAQATGATLILKGADTVVASPDGRASVNDNAPAWLATAGSGDVLAGMIGGLMARGMAPFEAASASVWLHGAAATHVGRGLIADDLPEALQASFQALAVALQASAVEAGR